ncbi:MAG: FprA family A-type flavoprotein [Dehalococcoidales bacterium]|nr:FprA family A-type flavoprotein [Dehalococcoidales bacterium]
MIQARQIKPGIYWVGAIDWDRRLFDELIPLPDGTSYNSYLIRGSQKTALIDTSDPRTESVFLERLDSLNVKNIDYVITNHAEQDHSGALPAVVAKYPQAKVLCTPKCKPMLMDMLRIPEDRITTVNDRETVSLGDKTLEFLHAPWVHWPETMLTYLKEDRILFPCDFFGSHLATSDLYVSNEGRVYESAKRYYAEIMMSFRSNIERHLEMLKVYAIDMIAPSHGPIHQKPRFIMDAYADWAAGPPKNLVVLPYISMHGSTRTMVNYLVEALAQKSVTVQQFDLSDVDIGKLAMALVDAATLVVGTPTVLIGPHPRAAYAAFLANALRPKLRFASIIGSYGWGGRAVEDLVKIVPNLKVELLPTVIAKGLPKPEDFQALENLAVAIAEKHKGLVPASP